jgi:hypothetical protein
MPLGQILRQERGRPDRGIEVKHAGIMINYFVNQRIDDPGHRSRSPTVVAGLKS